jgi:hypothetical protein
MAHRGLLYTTPPGDGTLTTQRTVLYLLIISAVWAFGLGSILFGQTPQEQPLMQPGSLVYVGQFRVPDSDGTGAGTGQSVSPKVRARCGILLQ